MISLHVPTSPAEIAGVLAFCILMLTAAFQDLLTMRISNRISILVAGGYFLMAAAAPKPLTEVAIHTAIAIGVLTVLLFPFAKGWMGGGDVKLIATSVLWFQPDQIMFYLAMVSLWGGILTFGILISRSLPMPATFYRWDWFERLHKNERKIPYGIGIAAGGIVTQYLILTV